MYSKELIYRDAKQIVEDSKSIQPYVIVAQPRRDLKETPAQQLDGMFPDIDLRGYSKAFINIGGEKVDVARNYLIEQCIESEAKYLFFVGEDTVIPNDGFTKLHETCERNPGAIAIGVYYMKNSSPMIMVKDGLWIVVADVSPGKVFPVHNAGMDAMLIPIDVLRRMKDAEPDNPFCCIVSNLDIDDVHVAYIGEDNYFYNRCHSMGIPILCNTAVQCLHVDLATGDYTAHESVNIDEYDTIIPIGKRLTNADRKYINNRWSDRIPDGSAGMPSADQVQEELDELLKIVKGKKLILEIGTNQGGTLYQFLKVADYKAEVVSIDLPGGIGNSGKVDNNLMQSWRLPQQVLHIIKADSHDESTVERVKDILNGRMFDFVFVDGDHSYNSVKTDYELYRNYAELMAFHDIVYHPQATGVKTFWDELECDKTEIIHDPEQGWAGIGILEVKHGNN